MKLTKHLTILFLILLTQACVYQANLAQGNFVDKEDLDQVEIGMTRNQVRFLLGTPMIDDPFHEDRWDYIYYLKIGREKAILKTWVSIFFENDTVSDINKNQKLNPNL
ncbi:MAG: outer membrane protein assembly factor BamE [Pseudomonadota bacterium]|nr:outer membrane protein assembly factor BamE [Pseudomonadota bacterium]